MSGSQEDTINAGINDQVILKNGRVLTMDDGPILLNADIWLSDGKILRVVERGAEPNVSDESIRFQENAKVIDCHSCYVIPGLIDSHVHYDESYMGDFFLASGVTTVRNMQGFDGHALWRDEILAGTRRGPWLYSSGPVYDGDDDTIPDNTNVILHTKEEVEEAIAYVKSRGFHWMKTYPMIEPELYRYLLKRCREEKLPVCGHMTKRMSHIELAKKGYYCCEHTSSLPADLEMVKLLAGTGMWFCPTHVVCETLPDYVWNGRKLEDLPHFSDLPACIRERWQEENKVIIENYRRLNVHPDFQTIIDRGKTFIENSDHIMAGTDCPYPGVVPGFSLAEELDRLVNTYGMTCYDALRAATCNPAEYMAIEKQKGRIVVGLDADLVVLEKNPLEDIKMIQSIKWVFQGKNAWSKETLQQFLTADSKLKKEEIEFIPLSLPKTYGKLD